MSVKFCQHVKVDGTLCQVPPLHGRHYCHFHLEHLGRRLRMARSRARREQYHLVLPILEDLNSVEVARQHVMDALGAGLIPHKVAGQLLFGLQGMASDMRSAKPPRLGVYDPAVDTAPRATEASGFEARYDLPPDLDLSKPPEVVFADEAAQHTVAQAEPSPYRSKLFRYGQVSPEDVELEEILKNEGEEAYQKRLQEQTGKAVQRIAKRRREVKWAGYVVEAERRNVEGTCSTPEQRERKQAEIEKERAEWADYVKRYNEAEAAGNLEAFLAASGQISSSTASGAAAAGKQPESATSKKPSEAVSGDSEPGKKPAAAVAGDPAGPEVAPKQEQARNLEAPKRMVNARH